MVWTRRFWLNRPNTSTPFNAAAMNNIEDGVEEAVTATRGRLSDANLTSTFVTDVAGKTAGSVTARNIREGLGLAVSPVDFGAVGDGTTNDSAACQAAVTWLEANGGGSLIVQRGKRFKITDGLFLVRNSTVPVNLIGEGGAFVGGTVTVGPASPAAGGVAVHGMRISGVEFDGGSAYGSLTLLSIGGVRGLTISDECYFRRGNIGIGTYGDTVFHSLAMLRVNKARFTELNYGIKHNASVWDYASDWDITDCYVNYAADTSFWIASDDGLTGGVDGLNFQGNVMFHLLSTNVGTARWDNKRYNLRMGKVDWLRVVNNNFFGAGLEAVYLRDLRDFTFVGNNIAWAGSRTKSPAVTIDTSASARGAITGNTISLWTQYGINVINGTNNTELEFGANEFNFEPYNKEYFGTNDVHRLRVLGTPTGGTFTLKVNNVATSTIAYNASAATIKSALDATGGPTATVVDNTGGVFTITFATAATLWQTSALTGGSSPSIELAPFLSTDASPSIYTDSSTLGYPNLRQFHYTAGVQNSIRGGTLQTRDQRNQVQGIASAWAAKTVAAGGTTIFPVTDIINVAARGGGLITITVRRGGGAADMIAHYLLFVAVQSATCTLLASGGRTTGASSDEPSFTWTMDTSGNLKAFRVGSTGGSTFYFDAVSVGALQMK